MCRTLAYMIFVKSLGFFSLIVWFVPWFQARRGGIDEPFAWESREFLRKLCIGKVLKAETL